MADAPAPAAPPAPVDPSASPAQLLAELEQLALGVGTPEHKLANITAILAMAATVCGAVMEVLSEAQILFPNAKGIGAAIAIAGLIAKAINSFGYNQGRAAIKAAALSAAKVALVLFALGAAVPSTAQAQTKTGMLSLSLPGNFDTHAGVGVTGVAYDFQQKVWTYTAISGLYALCYQPLSDACVAGGGSLTLVNGKPVGGVTAAILSPVIVNPFAATSSTTSQPGDFRFALTYTHGFAPSDDQVGVGIEVGF